MINALITGTLATDPKAGTSKSGTEWANCVVRVPCGRDKETGDAETAFVQIACFGSEAGKLARLTKGDSVSATGALKPTTYTKDGQERHGLSLTAQAIITAYGIAKKRGDDGKAANYQRADNSDREASRAYDSFAKGVKASRTDADFNDELSF
jgi:single-stranded DNA-binding protein